MLLLLQKIYWTQLTPQAFHLLQFYVIKKESPHRHNMGSLIWVYLEVNILKKKKIKNLSRKPSWLIPLN